MLKLLTTPPSPGIIKASMGKLGIQTQLAFIEAPFYEPVCLPSHPTSAPRAVLSTRDSGPAVAAGLRSGGEGAVPGRFGSTLSAGLLRGLRPFFSGCPSPVSFQLPVGPWS